MPSLNLVTARLIDAKPTGALCEYVVAGNGLFAFAEDQRINAGVPVAPAVCPGLIPVEPFVKLKLPRIPAAYLAAVLDSARRRLPNESAYQFLYDAGDVLPWRCVRPDQMATPTSVDYRDNPEAVVDLHSHGAMGAFFSATDNHDEGGLRFYCVIGEIGAEHPQLAVRVGVYGHHYPVPASFVFDGLGPFVDAFDKEIDL